MQAHTPDALRARPIAIYATKRLADIISKLTGDIPNLPIRKVSSQLTPVNCSSGVPEEGTIALHSCTKPLASTTLHVGRIFCTIYAAANRKRHKYQQRSATNRDVYLPTKMTTKAGTIWFL